LRIQLRDTLDRAACCHWGLGLALTPRLALAQTDAARERPREGNVLVAVRATPLAPLKPDDLTLDAKQTFAWQMDPATSTVAQRLTPKQGAAARIAAAFGPATIGICACYPTTATA
jgi:hypothetical protein